MKQLESKELIDIIWKDNKRDYLIQKVRLKTDHIEKAYQYVGRKPKQGLEEETITLLQKYVDVGAAITAAFARYLIERIQNHQSVKEYIALENRKETEKFLRACVLVEQNRNACYRREFSIMHFRDSKYFEQIESRIAKVFRHFSGEDLSDIRFSDLSRIRKVVTIENLTSFFRYWEKDSLSIYLGGYHNRIRRALLKLVYEAIPDARYYHFGDIDAGGFSILLDLREKTGIPFAGYHMDLDTLKRYRQYAKRLTESDRKRLEKLGREKEFCEIIGFMLKENVKLEQECII